VLPPAAGSRAMATPARRPSFRPSAPEWPTTGNYDTMIVQRSPLPQITLEIMCRSGSQDDPKDKEGLAALAGAMVAEAGSARMTIDEIRAALYPMAGSFTAQVDKEVTTFTASIHKDNWLRFFEIVLPQLLEPGFRPEDFKRLKARQMSALVEDLRASNEEELGKERLQENVFRWRGGQGAEGRLPWAHPVLGTVAGIEAITLGDVKAFVAQYGASLPYVGVAGDVPDDFLSTLKTRLEKLPAVDDTRDTGVPPAMAPLRGIEVEIIEKDTRGTFISLGHPIAVTRQHADFPALSVARAWLGEHRASTGRLYQRIREVRGMNYGDYAYIEAFPRGMSQFFPDPNLVRHHQVFEIWIRPVVPAHAHMALRIAIHELDALIRNGISKEDFEATRGYLMKNVYVMTARQDQQLGYALDSHWYGILELTQYLRGALARLTPEDVNRAVRQHLSATNLSVVIVTKNTRELRDRLVSDAFSPIVYDGEKPRALLEEDKVIGALKLGINPAKVRITPVAEVFAR
jgi:zinc protease